MTAPPTHLTVNGKTHKITPTQWRALTRAAHNSASPGDDCARLAVVRQLAAKGLCSAPHSWDKYERTEWGRKVATLHGLHLLPGVADAVRTLVEQRRRAGQGDAP